MADCALCNHPHEPGERCKYITGAAEFVFGYLPVFCDCPHEPPEDQEEA